MKIVSKSSDFLAAKNYLQQELNEMESGKATFISQEELETRLNEID